MTKRECELAMRLVIAASINEFWGGGASPEELGLTDLEMNIMADYADNWANRIAENHPLHLGSVEAAFNYVKSLKK